MKSKNDELKKSVKRLEKRVSNMEKRQVRSEIRSARESARVGGALRELFERRFKGSQNLRDVLRQIDITRGNEEIARIVNEDVRNVRTRTAFLKREGLIEKVSNRPARYKITEDGKQILRLCDELDD